MRLTPAHEDHSIVEVVFHLELDRPWTAPDLQRIERIGVEFRDELPAFRKFDQLPMTGPGGVAWQGPIALGVEFAAYRRDGTFEWRLQCAGSTATVNCLAYTRWQRICTTALRHFSDVFRETEHRQLRAVTLQYIDEFLVETDGQEYDWCSLFDLGCDLLPPALGSWGALWHLHQGWFTETLATSGSSLATARPDRMLQRLHVDSVARPVTGSDRREHVVRIDHFQRLEPAEPVGTGALEEKPQELRTVFDRLHDGNKAILRALLSESIKKRIGLDAGI